MALSTIDDDEVFELTNIKVKEVSLVDRAANKRTFVVVKRDKKGTGEPITADDVAKAAEKAAENMAGTPAAELDRLDAEAAAAAKTETPAQEEKKSDTVVTDGNITVTVTDSNYSATPAEQALETKIRMAWQGAISAVQARLQVMSEQVATDSFWPWEHIEYICCMLDSMYEIGGPEWEIEVAATNAAKAKGEDVAKREAFITAITKAVESRKATVVKPAEPSEQIKSLHEVVEQLKSLIVAKNSDIKVEEKIAEEPKVEAKKEEAPAITQPVVEEKKEPIAPAAPVFDITQDPAFKALSEKLSKQDEIIGSLKGKLSNQEQVIEKARSNMRTNALIIEDDLGHTENVRWDRDMASPSSRVSSRYSR